MKTIIIGGGITGLTLAYKLTQAGKKVVLLEKDESLGGLLASYKIKNYYIEKYYHHFFGGDETLISLLKELGLENKILWLKAKTGYLIDGRIYPLNTPLEILKFPPLSFLDKIRLAF